MTALKKYLPKTLILCLLILVFCFKVNAQIRDTIGYKNDTSLLKNVIVTAFASHVALNDVPASVAVLDKNDLSRSDNNSLVSASNTIPGVRMDERSPGSYRFSIRGSLLQSPFGVGNVKIYWDDIPFTDATGNTYLAGC